MAEFGKEFGSALLKTLGEDVGKNFMKQMTKKFTPGSSKDEKKPNEEEKKSENSSQKQNQQDLDSAWSQYRPQPIPAYYQPRYYPSSAAPQPAQQQASPAPQPKVINAPLAESSSPAIAKVSEIVKTKSKPDLQVRQEESSSRSRGRSRSASRRRSSSHARPKSKSRSRHHRHHHHRGHDRYHDRDHRRHHHAHRSHRHHRDGYSSSSSSSTDECSDSDCSCRDIGSSSYDRSRHSYPSFPQPYWQPPMQPAIFAPPSPSFSPVYAHSPRNSDLGLRAMYDRSQIGTPDYRYVSRNGSPQFDGVEPFSAPAAMHSFQKYQQGQPHSRSKLSGEFSAPANGSEWPPSTYAHLSSNNNPYSGRESAHSRTDMESRGRTRDNDYLR